MTKAASTATPGAGKPKPSLADIHGDRLIDLATEAVTAVRHGDPLMAAKGRELHFILSILGDLLGITVPQV